MPDDDAITFAPVTVADLPRLREWLQRPHVAEWWGLPESLEELHEDFVARAHEPRATQAFIASLGARPIGFIQCYWVMGSGDGWWEDETDATARGIDQFLADPAELNQGLGRAMIRCFVDRLLAVSDASFVQTDPSPTNARAIRCYQAAGFVPVGEVTTPDGPALLLKRYRSADAFGAG